MENQTIRQIAERTRILSQIISDICETSYLSQVAPAFLTRTQFTILNILHTTGNSTVSDLANLLHISRAAASKNIEILVRNHLIKRGSLRRDRRTYRITLLDAGEKIVGDYENLRLQKMKETLSLFSEEEKEIFADLLGKYIRICLEHEQDINLICLQCDGSISDECAISKHSDICHFQIKREHPKLSKMEG